MVDFEKIENTVIDYTYDDTNVIVIKDPSKPFVVVVPSEDGSTSREVFLLDTKEGRCAVPGSFNAKDLYVSGQRVIDQDGKIDFSTLKNFTIKGDDYIIKSSLSGDRLINNSVSGSKVETNTLDNAKIRDNTITKSKVSESSRLIEYEARSKLVIAVNGTTKEVDAIFSVRLELSPFMANLFIKIDRFNSFGVFGDGENVLEYSEAVLSIDDLPYFKVEGLLSRGVGTVWRRNQAGTQNFSDVISVSTIIDIDRSRNELRAGILDSSIISIGESVRFIEVTSSFLVGDFPLDTVAQEKINEAKGIS